LGFKIVFLAEASGRFKIPGIRKKKGLGIGDGSIINAFCGSELLWVLGLKGADILSELLGKKGSKLSGFSVVLRLFFRVVTPRTMPDANRFPVKKSNLLPNRPRVLKPNFISANTRPVT